VSLVRIDARIRCPFCHDSVLTGARTGCSECLAWHHTSCLLEHGACSTCGAPHHPRSEGSTIQNVGAVLALVCRAQHCYSVDTLDRPGRSRLCEHHAQSELAGITVGGALALIAGIALGAVTVYMALIGEQGPWPLLIVPAQCLLVFGLIAIYRHSGEKAVIEAAVARKTQDAVTSPAEVEVRALREKVSQ
jgi:hypothetical protein